MPRKNGSARRRNTRMNRRQKGEPRVQRDLSQPRISLDDLVLPDGHCPLRKSKARFGTPEKAQKALEQAQAQRRRSGSTHVEKRWYRCPAEGCGGYHLTSREEYDEGLATRRYEQRKQASQ